MFILSRWAGGLVDKYGSLLPLVIGPLIAAAGFALFVLAGAESQSYWTSVFPAVMVMSVGMTVAVAPLTTTVMGAVDERHAGIASGINNAVSRTAGLLAVAVFGVAMFAVFGAGLEKRAASLPVDAGARDQIISERGRFIELEPPPGLSDEQRSAVKLSVKQSFVDGFHVVSLCSAGLAVLSAFFAWLLIPKKTKDNSRGPV